MHLVITQHNSDVVNLRGASSRGDRYHSLLCLLHVNLWHVLPYAVNYYSTIHIVTPFWTLRG